MKKYLKDTFNAVESMLMQEWTRIGQIWNFMYEFCDIDSSTLQLYCISLRFETKLFIIIDRTCKQIRFLFRSLVLFLYELIVENSWKLLNSSIQTNFRL
jgi:hypothetical protein